MTVKKLFVEYIVDEKFAMKIVADKKTIKDLKEKIAELQK